MYHEVIHQVKLVKYNIKSHEIIRIKQNNGKEENDIRTNTHMKCRDFETESSSGLHCTNWYWSADHPMDRSSNCLCIGSTTSTNFDRVRVSCNGPDLTKWAWITEARNCTHITYSYILEHYHTRTQAYTQAYAVRARARTRIQQHVHI